MKLLSLTILLIEIYCDLNLIADGRKQYTRTAIGHDEKKTWTYAYA